MATHKKLAYILQGVSGSGKSTLAKSLVAGLPVGQGVSISADQYFIDEKGEYRFDVSKLGTAHQWCLRSFVAAVAEAPVASVVVVDNTNCTVAEVAPYYALAEAYGYAVTILVVGNEATLGDCANRNVHGVPLAGVTAQGNRLAQFERAMPPWWTRYTVEEWQGLGFSEAAGGK